MSQIPRQLKPKKLLKSCKVLGHSFPITYFNIMSSNCLNSLWKIKMDYTAVLCVFTQSPQMSQIPRQLKPNKIWKSCKVLGHSFPNTNLNIMSSNCLNSLWKIKMDYTAVLCVFTQSPQMSQIPRQLKPNKIWKSCKVLGHSFPNTNFNIMSSNCLNSLWKVKMDYTAGFVYSPKALKCHKFHVK